MWKKVFFKCFLLFLLLFLAGVSFAYSLSSSYLFLEKTQINTSNVEMLLLITPEENFSSGSELLISFPNTNIGDWCKQDELNLSVSGVSYSKLDISNWEIDAPLPGALTGKCHQGDGIDSNDRIVISNIDSLVGGVSYAVSIAPNPNLSTGPLDGSNNVLVQLRRGVIAEATAYSIYLQSPAGVTVSAFVDEDHFSTVNVLDPVVEKGIWSRVRVRVVDSKGNPLSGRSIEINLDSQNLNNWEFENKTGITNSSGIFQTRVRSFKTEIVNVTAIDKSFSQNVYIQDSDNLTVTEVPTINLHQLPMYTPGFSRKISWNTLGSGYMYFIECSLDPEFKSIEKTSGWISKNDFTFQNLEHGKAYYYRGKARNIANVESAYSNIVSSIQAEKPIGAIEVLDPIVEKGVWSNVRVTIVDSKGNPLSGRKIFFEIDRSNLSKWDIEHPSGTTNSQGVATGRIRGFEIATVKVRAVDKTIPLNFYIDDYDWLQVTGLPTLELHNLPNYSKGLSRMINWNNIQGNYEYLIQSSTNPDFTNPRNSGWISVNQFLFTNLKHGQGYFYRGKVRNQAKVEGSYSNVVSSIQDNEPPTIEKVDFEIIKQGGVRRARFTFLIKDLSKVTSVNFRCKDLDNEHEESYVSCGQRSSLNNFHYILFDKESLEGYEISEDLYFLEYCVRADDIVGNRGTFCSEKEFSIDAVEVIEEIEEPVHSEEPKEGIVTRVVTPAREAARRSIEDTVTYIQELRMDDRGIGTAAVAIVTAVTPATLLSLLLNPANFYPISQLFLGIIGVFKRKKKVLPYGYIYDSVTKEPINKAIVRIYKGKKLALTTVSNVYGAFTAKLEPGEYFLKVSMVGYAYPSKLVTGNVDSPLQNIYRGGKFVVNEESYLQYSIPLDPVDTSNFKYLKVLILSRLGKVLFELQKVFVVLGLLIAFFLFLRNPETFNLVILILYVPLLFLHLFLSYSDEKNSFGVVKNSQGKALQNVILGLKEMEFEKLVAKRVTNEKGRYKFLVPGGKYKLEVLSPGYFIKSPKDQNLFFEGNIKKPLLIDKNIVLERREA